MKYRNAGLWLTLLLSACSAQYREPPETLVQPLDKAGYQQGESINAIKSFSISSWQYLDDEHIIIESRNAAYLIRFIIPCQGIATANILRYSGTAGTLSTMDHIFSGYQRCSVHSIHILQEKPDTNPG